MRLVKFGPAYINPEYVVALTVVHEQAVQPSPDLLGRGALAQGHAYWAVLATIDTANGAEEHFSFGYASEEEAQAVLSEFKESHTPGLVPVKDQMWLDATGVLLVEPNGSGVDITYGLQGDVCIFSISAASEDEAIAWAADIADELQFDEDDGAP
jgi:hypothetical protein